MLVRGCHAPVLCTPGDGRSASQGTDLPRAVGEKRRQRHFGILWQAAQSEISRAAFFSWTAVHTCLRDIIPQTPFCASRRFDDVSFGRKALRYLFRDKKKSLP